MTKQPKRGILKASTSFEQREQEHQRSSKNPHFDEMNILATLHPADKDYGFMKIDEPKTPYEYASGGSDDEAVVVSTSDENSSSVQAKPLPDELDANLLAEKISTEGPKGPRPRRISEPSADEEDLQLLTPEERERRKSFEQKRKAHYNEFYAVKMARQLMQEEGDDEDSHTSDKNDPPPTTSTSATKSSTTPVASSPMDTSNNA